MSWKYWEPDARNNGPVGWKTRAPERPRIQNNSPDGFLLVRLMTPQDSRLERFLAGCGRLWRGEVSPRVDAWVGWLSLVVSFGLLWSMAVMLG